MKKNHGLRALNYGTFRIGTLYEFQNIEKHGESIGDLNEGRKHIQNDPREQYDYCTPGGAPEFVRSFVNAPNLNNVSIQRCTFTNTYVSPNLYLFCLTDVLSTTMMEAFEADLVLKIEDINAFGKALNTSLRKKGNVKPAFESVRCKYINRSSHYSAFTDTHPAHIKDPSYKYQSEIRLIWTPRKEPIMPEIITSKAARKYCTLVDHDELQQLYDAPRKLL